MAKTMYFYTHPSLLPNSTPPPLRSNPGSATVYVMYGLFSPNSSGMASCIIQQFNNFKATSISYSRKERSSLNDNTCGNHACILANATVSCVGFMRIKVRAISFYHAV